MPENGSYSSENVLDTSHYTVQARWLWVTLLVAATLAVLGGRYAYYRSETDRIRQQKKYEEMEAIAKLKASQIQQWRQERIKDLWRSSGGRFFGKGLQEFLRDRNNPVLREELQRQALSGHQVTTPGRLL